MYVCTNFHGNASNATVGKNAFTTAGCLLQLCNSIGDDWNASRNWIWCEILGIFHDWSIILCNKPTADFGVAVIEYGNIWENGVHRSRYIHLSPTCSYICLCNKQEGHMTESVPTLWIVTIFRDESRGAVLNHSYDSFSNKALGEIYFNGQRTKSCGK